MSNDTQYQEQLFEQEQFIYTEYLEFWVGEAYNLADSAIILYDKSIESALERFAPKIGKIPVKQVSSHGVQRMLWGYAFENLFKALIIRKLKKEKNIKKLLLEDIMGHDLIKLASKAKVKLAEEQKLYLNVCSECSTWAGRYPIPRNANQLLKSRKTIKSRYAKVSGTEIDIYKKLFIRLKKLIGTF